MSLGSKEQVREKLDCLKESRKKKKSYHKIKTCGNIRRYKLRPSMKNKNILKRAEMMSQWEKVLSRQAWRLEIKFIAPIENKQKNGILITPERQIPQVSLTVNIYKTSSEFRSCLQEVSWEWLSGTLNMILGSLCWYPQNHMTTYDILHRQQYNTNNKKIFWG